MTPSMTPLRAQVSPGGDRVALSAQRMIDDQVLKERLGEKLNRLINGIGLRDHSTCIHELLIEVNAVGYVVSNLFVWPFVGLRTMEASLYLRKTSPA
jgi:hypothetical protein